MPRCWVKNWAFCGRRARGFWGAASCPPQDKGQLVVLRQRVTELQAETLRSFDRALERNPQFRQSMGSKTQ